MRKDVALRDDDPEPLPPLPPEAGACCGSGCNPCVLDLYEEERQQYLAQLRAWRERRDARERAAAGTRASNPGG